MGEQVAVFMQHVVGREIIVEVPEGYTSDDIVDVNSRWSNPYITMKDGKHFGQSHIVEPEDELNVIRETDFGHEGDDYKRSTYMSVMKVSEDIYGYDYGDIVVKDGEIIHS